MVTSDRVRQQSSAIVGGIDLHGSAVATLLIAARMGCQALVLVGVARLMGAQGYGVFAAVVALASVFSPLCGFGSDFVALRATAQDASRAREVFRRTLVLIFLSGIPLMAVIWALAFSGFMTHAPATLVGAVLVADLLFMRMTELAAKIFQGDRQMFQMGIVRLLPALFRLLAIGGLSVAAIEATPAAWALYYLAASALAAGISTVLIYRRYAPAATSPAMVYRWRDGLHFAGGVMSVRMHTEADKALVLSLSGASGAGIYAAAYRLIEFALVPVGGVVAAAYGRLFAEARHGGDTRVTRTALRSSLTVLILGCMVGVALWIAMVPVMVWAVGAEFVAVEEGKHALALLPIAMSLRMTGEQNVAALGALRTRTLVQWSVGLAALSANVAVIPLAGWTGSAWICVVTESVLGIAYLALVLRRHRAGIIR